MTIGNKCMRVKDTLANSGAPISETEYFEALCNVPVLTYDEKCKL